MIKANYWKKVVVLAVVVAIGCTIAAQAEPKNVIFFIGDGMGPEHVKAAGMYVYGYDYGDTAWLSFESFPYNGELTTYSANASITDSAAATTALATGFKVNNGVISMAYPGDGSELETLLEYSKALGKSTGLVTTVYVTHATPAGFGAHEPDRNNNSNIANDYLTQTRPNVIYGGSSYMSGADGANYTEVFNRAEMLAYYDTSPETMLSGQFDSGDLPYEADYDYDSGTIPRLSEMTDAALSILDNDADGFFLMVEGGNIDHASHDGNFEAMVLEVVEFSNAVQVAIDWAAGRNDTLILVAADHETGPPSGLVNNGAGILPSYSSFGGDHTSANVPVYAIGVNAELIGGEMDNTDMFGVVTATINPEASNPNPADDATGVDIDADLSWTAGAGAVSHDVYFGTTNPPDPVQNQSETTYDPGTLVPNTTYYWAIDELDSIGGIAYGAVWSFTTASLPGQASNPSPTGTEVGVDSDLSWSAGSDTTSHNVYFGMESASLPLVSEGQSETTYDPGILINDETYYWRIDEVGPGGVTTGIVWSFTTVVAAPGQASNPNPGNGTSNVGVDSDLNWAAGAGATSHDVYFGTTSPGTLQGSQTDTTFDPGTMDNDKTYYWRIDERNTGGTTTGTVWSFTTTLAAPGQASSPSPAHTATSVAIDADLSWTEGSDAASHDVYLGTNYHDVISASESSSEFQGNQTGTTYEPGLLNPGTPYYWRIDEENVGGTTTGEVWSFTTKTAETVYDAYVSQEPIVTFGEVVGTIQGTIEAGDDLVQEITEVPDGHPLNGSLQVEYVLHTTANRTDITDLTLYLGLTWTELDADDPLISEIGIWNGTGWTDITGSIGGSYTPSNPQDYVDAGGDIRVRFTDTQAVKKENKDTLTIDLLYADISAGPVNAAPSVGITVPAEGAEFTEGDDITIQADAADSDGTVTKVEFYQNGSKLGEATTSPYSYTWNSVPSGSYSLTAKATDDGGATTTSAPVNITVTDTTPPAAPTSLTATAVSDTQIDLDWADNAEPDFSHYNVYRSATSGGSYAQIASNVMENNYSDTSLTAATTYYYVARAVDTSSNESGNSNEASATTKPPNVPPSVDITAPAEGAEFTEGDNITIQAVAEDSDGTVTKVEFYQNGSKLGEVTSSPYSYTWNSVPSGSYSLTAKATDDGGATTTSAPVNITVTDTTAPAAPTGLAATAGDGQVSLDWDDNSESDLDGYNIYRSETSGSGYVKISGAVPVSGSNYLDTTVVNDTAYYYVVTAVDSATPTPNESGYSSEVSATPTAQVSDVVTITRADYRIRQKVFTVQATSSQGGVAVLTVVGYGEMTYNVEENLYTFRQTVATAPGDTVTVESDLGGSDTASVTHK